MGEFLDRDHQRVLLEGLRDCYPDRRSFACGQDEQSRRLAVNLQYLLELDLIAGEARRSGSGGYIFHVKISARGLDFLQDDGGMSAILGVVTIRLHQDTLRQLIDARIDADPAASTNQKAEAKSALRRLSEKSLQTLVEEVTKKGLEHFPELFTWLDQAAHAAFRAVGG